MAKISLTGKKATVEKGDTLSEILQSFISEGLVNKNTSVTQLAAANNITNPDLIYVDQEISATGTATTTGSTSASSNLNAPTINAFGLQSNKSNTLFATWTWNQEHTKEYAVEWTYATGSGIWFVGSNSTNPVNENNPELAKQSTYTIPSNATSVRFRVKPISETRKENDTETPYWTSKWTDYKTYTDTVLDTPPTPSIKVEKYKLTATIENLNVNAPSIQFELYKDDTTLVERTKYIEISTTNHVSYTWTVDAGGRYKVRARSYKVSTVLSAWSEFSNEVTTIPAASSGITTIKADSESSVYLEWAEVKTAKSYEIEYTTNKDYFDASSDTTTVSGIENTHYIITGLESGDEYFFRLRAVNDEGESAWTDIVSIVIGEDPAAPTTWSSTTTCITGESLVLYWVHNSQDNSSQTYAELELIIGGIKETHTIENTDNEDDKDRTSSYTIDTTEYKEGTQIQWRVRTAGITKAYGDWSVQRTVDIYAPPTLALNITDLNGNSVYTLESFPFYIYALPGPNTQAPIGYHVSITSSEVYETTDNVGNVKMVNAGEEIYSKYFDISTELLVEMSAGNIDLENGITYTVTVTVSMNSGLTTEASSEFNVSWTDLRCEPNARIGIDTETLVAQIHPYCEYSELVFYKVNYDSDIYTVSNETVEMAEGYPVENNGAKVYATTGEQVFSGTTTDGVSVYYTTIEEKSLLEDVTLSVYRREFDGSFTEIATGINNTANTFVTDPHPSLDYARYRIVAITNSTGAVSYYDVPGYPVEEKAVIIQWDEEWSTFDVEEGAVLAEPPWSGSLLKLPYNVDVSDSHSSDVSLVKYIGRKRPVSYYGTQLGETSSWSMEIPKSDKETLYALRRLAIWMEDVYVREPSGSGYWASISVSFSQKHCETTIPVSLDITRVEGGM